LIAGLADQWAQRSDSPLVMYFHIWELDPEQVRIDGAPALARIRHYRNLDRMSVIWEDYLSRYRFTSVAETLSIDVRAAGAQPSSNAAPVAGIRTGAAPRKSNASWTPATLVVPCYNEEQILPYLANTLRSVLQSLGNEYEISLVFVDDGSTDQTHHLLLELFGSWPRAEVLRHDRNRGVAAAIMTGIRHAKTEIVCAIDCDCTYDPHILAEMIPKLDPGVDVVTASPYHPEGQVRNVPAWRLGLSKVSSFLYRRVLKQKLHTYTSCFRVYRRSAVQDLQLWNGHFIGVAEILGRLDLKCAKIIEHPATLEVRLIGRSKMKVLKAALGHLRLMARLLLHRLFRRAKSQQAAALARLAGPAIFMSVIPPF
jgi:glycosyltransferase involved in cell wall biosynthesis